MRRSIDRILVSHAGNLPRPDDLNRLLAAGESERVALNKRLPSAVAEVVERQIACGVDVVNDGEYVKAGSYTGYINQRITGIEMQLADLNRPPKHAGTGGRDRRDFPGFYASGLWYSGSGGPVRPGFATPGPQLRDNPPQVRVCTGPVQYVGHDAIQSDIATLKAAIQGKDVEGFIAAIGPCSVSTGPYNDYYPSQEAFLFGTAEALREEYKAITDASLILQIDEPELATSWQFFPDMTVPEYRKYVEMLVEAINHALTGLPEENIRLHFCWGSGHRPHVYDIPLRDIADIVLKVKAQAYSIEASNVCHEHEWRVWEDVQLPEGKILMPGVIGHATDLVEHPELVAQRLVRYARLVGRENVQAGTDCGIGSRVGHEEIVWAKLKALAEGVRLASKELWS
jgi:5-methyltetrahydropteroyltriglutamate--homocysteine methyltransferase